MVLELHVWGPAFGLPSIDPQCLATIAYFSLAVGQKNSGPEEEWVVVADSDPGNVPTHELPALWTGTRWISRFRNIVDYLKQYSNGEWDLDGLMSEKEKADCAAFSSFVESYGQPLIDLSLYVSSENYYAITSPAYGSLLQWPNQWILPPRLRTMAKTRTEHLGLSSLDLDAAEEEQQEKASGRQPPSASSQIPKSLATKSRETISGLLSKTSQQNRIRLDGITEAFVGPLEELLGGKGYLLADKTPCSLDCLALGYLSLAIVPAAPSPWLREGVHKYSPRLVRYFDQLRLKCYGGDIESIETVQGTGSAGVGTTALPWQASEPASIAGIAFRVAESLADAVPMVRELRASRRFQQLSKDMDSKAEQEAMLVIARVKRREAIASTATVVAGLGMLVWYLLAGMKALICGIITHSPSPPCLLRCSLALSVLFPTGLALGQSRIPVPRARRVAKASLPPRDWTRDDESAWFCHPCAQGPHACFFPSPAPASVNIDIIGHTPDTPHRGRHTRTTDTEEDDGEVTADKTAKTRRRDDRLRQDDILAEIADDPSHRALVLLDDSLPPSPSTPSFASSSSLDLLGITDSYRPQHTSASTYKIIYSIRKEIMDQLLASTLARRVAAEGDAAFVACNTGNEYNGQINLRISAIFVILIGSMGGAVLPVFARHDPNSTSKYKLPSWVFFIAKFFGSGVIIATSFIHLLAPAHEALSHPCLTGPIKEYPWVEGILLMTIIVLFFVELMVIRYARFGQDDHDHPKAEPQVENGITTAEPKPSGGHNHDHLGHSRDHPSDGGSDVVEAAHTTLLEDFSAQLTSVFILEFGIIFHSIFIGLTLAVAGEEFKTLYIVLAFHQTFEGLGLGSRLATIPWPNSKRHTPYLLAIAFGLSTPIAIAVGLGVRNSYPPEGRTTLIVNGIFDSISSGILVYTSLVELMAHEFMFSTSMRRAPIRTVLSAFGLLCMGALLMALLGKWA
ncbi:uncharacterized protein GIQ15_05958 [Arthroderma uncinatum]|uniref:uncharacterized protein n=1 Tax=Arthroderma uncinatum TaxID=74035 RepID=UPI00144AA27E|nr:uncharacterized protein GIQ15_05958 [Arthroderma uncinatum]KAF3480611.1 hypothetical protein GIQ15_05958 [Arthroderma uncinatum]